MRGRREPRSYNASSRLGRLFRATGDKEGGGRKTGGGERSRGNRTSAGFAFPRKGAFALAFFHALKHTVKSFKKCFLTKELKMSFFKKHK